MSRSRYGSHRLRYLKARLSILARPSFLMALVFLSAVGLVIKEYWTNPDFLKFAQNQQVFPLTPTSSSNQSLISEEDKAIAADIDNLSVLDYDKQKTQIPATTDIDDRNQVKKQNEAQLSKILDLAKKNTVANEIKPNTQTQISNTSSTSQQNPFLAQAKNLLKFNIGNNEDSRVNNLAPFSSGLQTPQTSFNLGIQNSNSANQNQNTTPENALKAAVNKSNNQTQENLTATTSTNNNIFGQSAQTSSNSILPTTTANSGLRQNGINPLVDTTLFNQPLNSQQQNPSNNFNNTQLPTNNYNQPGINNQAPNPYNNFSNTQLPTNNYNQPGINNQVPNPYNNFSNTQLPTNNYNQPGINNQVPNPYNNFNNQPSNDRSQNPDSNFNNDRIMGSRYDMSTQTRINNIYNKLNNSNNPAVFTPNNYAAPNNNINTGVQPNIQQFNPTYSPQNPLQVPNNGYGY
jgi:hypothetical protein